MQYHTHLVLVSGQPTPNLTPMIDPAVKPQRVIMLVSPDMQQRSEWLESIYRPRGIKVDRWEVDNAWNIQHLQLRFMELIEQERELVASGSLALNATGGTKPMSFAAYEVFRTEQLPIYYVHPETDELIWLYPEERAPHQLADRIRINDFVRAHGAQVIGQGSVQVPPDYRDLARQLVDDIDYFSKALGVLNWYAHSAENQLRSEQIDQRYENFDAFQDLLDRMEQLQLLRVQDRRLCFKDEAARFFANGGWLEQYVFATLNSLKKDLHTIQDTAQSVEIARGDGKSPNELDVVVLANNRLHLIECKAKTFKRGDAKSGAETLYKLDSLVDNVGGLQARAMLLSYKELSHHDAQRARDLGIKVLQGRQLQSLDAHFKAWLN